MLRGATTSTRALVLAFLAALVTTLAVLGFGRVADATPSAGALPLPTMPTTPSVSVPPLTVPSVSVPGVTVAPVTVPVVSTPAVTTPGVTTPGLTTPGVSTPGITPPTVSIPGVTEPTSLPTVPVTVALVSGATARDREGANSGLAERARSFAPPIGLLIAVVIFLVVQHRIDRRDPKLAGAPLDRLAASIGFE